MPIERANAEDSAQSPILLDAAMRSEAMFYARALGCDEATADELTQLASVSLWRRGMLGGGCRSLVRRAMRTAVRYQYLEHRRRVARDRLKQDASWADAVDRAWRETGIEADPDSWLDALHRCLKSLPARSRAVARLFYEESRSRGEIAAQFGMRETGVKTLLQRLRARLRTCVQRRMQ